MDTASRQLYSSDIGDLVSSVVFSEAARIRLEVQTTEVNSRRVLLELIDIPREVEDENKFYHL